MTKRRLETRLLAVMALLAVTIGVGGVLKLKFEEEPQYYELFKDLLPAVLGMLAVYLAGTFQERSNFVQSLRSLWSHLIEAKNEILRYTRDELPSKEKYEAAFGSLSMAIDEMRGVYKNVGETTNYRGLYPYEPLHDMRKALEHLGYGSRDPNHAKLAGERIMQAWYALRPKFLAEFDPPEPTDPIIQHNAVDSRKPGRAS
jgi:hypothetical protein